MTPEQKAELMKAIQDGIGGTITRLNEVEQRSTGVLEKVEAGFTGLKTDQETISKKISDFETKLATFDGKLITVDEHLRQRKLGTGVSASVSGLEGKELKKFSLGRVMATMGMIAMNPADAKALWEKHAPFEYEVQKEIRQKALDTGTGGAGGGYLVPQEYLAAEFIDLLRAELVVVRAGARVLGGLTGKPAKIMSQVGTSTPYWVGENATITQSNPTFAEQSMSPKIMAMRAQISNLEMLLSNPDVENLVRQDFAAVSALEIDRVALRGAGTLEPVGLVNTPSIPTIAMGTDGAAMTIESFIDFEGTLEDANALRGSLSFIFGPKVKRLLKKTRIPQFSGDTGGMYLLPPVMTDQMVRDLLGYNYFTSTAIPTNLTKGAGTNLSEVYFGNFNDLIIGMWGGVEILATNIGGNAWAQNAVEIRLVQNLDIHVRRLASFVVATDVKTTA